MVNTRLWDVDFLLWTKEFSNYFHRMFREVKPKEEINKKDIEKKKKTLRFGNIDLKDLFTARFL